MMEYKTNSKKCLCITLWLVIKITDPESADSSVSKEEKRPTNLTKKYNSCCSGNSDEANGGQGGSSGEDEKEFQPTIDMIMNDFDDERTMEEEEANEADEGDNDEDEVRE